jgi:hypothetical protein
MSSRQVDLHPEAVAEAQTAAQCIANEVCQQRMPSSPSNL